MSANIGRAENDRETLFLRAKPSLRHTILGIFCIVLGTVFVWAFFDLPASTVREHIISVLSFIMGTFLVCCSLILILGPIFGYPRLKLDDNYLVFVDTVGRSSVLNLGELGRATVFQGGRGTWLAFLTLDEERALAKKGDLTKPNGFNAAKYVPVSPLIGNSFQRAQELADHINASRNGSVGQDVDARDPEAAIKNIKQRGSRRLWMFFLIIVAASIFAIVL